MILCGYLWYLLIDWNGSIVALIYLDLSKQWLDVYKLPYEEWMSNMDNMETLAESPTANVGNDDENRNTHEDLQEVNFSYFLSVLATFR